MLNNSAKEYSINFMGQNLILSLEKAIYWKEREALILSDLHLGKAGHFRKSGIAIPKTVDDVNLYRLDALVKKFAPKIILFLGDLFHSHKNTEWKTFVEWRQKHQQIEMHLAIGNHDFYSPHEYHEIGLTTSSLIEAPPFLLLHDEMEAGIEIDAYPISGHIHPSVRLVGKGRQVKKIPCFYFGKSGALLPAFGNFTGTHTIKPEANELVFGIVEDQITMIS
ncbi:MAG: ligase-associated DNA damage response endonuclease PdeM [Balneola sp.]